MLFTEMEIKPKKFTIHDGVTSDERQREKTFLICLVNKG